MEEKNPIQVADRLFQTLELLAERGLGDMQPLRGQCDFSLLCDGDEVFQLFEIHKLSSDLYLSNMNNIFII